jgi:hypothetical protein
MEPPKIWEVEEIEEVRRCRIRRGQVQVGFKLKL